nr:MAG TPA: hypothetical protein [Caudoviricetes sp.]
MQQRRQKKVKDFLRNNVNPPSACLLSTPHGKRIYRRRS